MPDRPDIENMTADQLAEYRATVPVTCVICWQPGTEPLDNGVCPECRRVLKRRPVALAAENAKLTQEVEGLRAALDDQAQKHATDRALLEEVEAEVEELRELAATATRAHTRAIHALGGRGWLDYPETERAEMGRYLSQELQRHARE